MKRHLPILAMLLLGSAQLMAQTRDVSGTVTDKSDASGIPGVNIAVKGSSVGTVTDSNGKFALKAPTSATTLVVSYIGFATQELAIADNMEISLEPSAEQLNEVVVSVGRGSQAHPDGDTATD